mgnify:CR=1 FL=1
MRLSLRLGRLLTAVMGAAFLAGGCSGSVESIVGFRVESLDPGVVQAGDTDVAWTVRGAGFDPAATVTVTAPGVSIANVVIVSDQEITFELTALNTVAAGTASVAVMNPDGQSRGLNVPTLPENVTLSGLVQPIFDANCVGCHSGGAPAGGLNLSTGVTHGAVVDVPSTGVPTMDLIDPGNAETSYLLEKVVGTATVGAIMPPNAAPLSATDIALIVAWVEAGALDD